MEDSQAEVEEEEVLPCLEVGEGEAVVVEACLCVKLSVKLKGDEWTCNEMSRQRIY